MIPCFTFRGCFSLKSETIERCNYLESYHHKYLFYIQEPFDPKIKANWIETITVNSRSRIVHAWKKAGIAQNIVQKKPIFSCSGQLPFTNEIGWHLTVQLYRVGKVWDSTSQVVPELIIADWPQLNRAFRFSATQLPRFCIHAKALCSLHAFRLDLASNMAASPIYIWLRTPCFRSAWLFNWAVGMSQ